MGSSCSIIQIEEPKNKKRGNIKSMENIQNIQNEKHRKPSTWDHKLLYLAKPVFKYLFYIGKHHYFIAWIIFLIYCKNKVLLI